MEESHTAKVNVESDNSSRSKSWIGTRHIQCVCLFLGLTCAYALRVNMSVAIVAMTKSSNHGKSDFEEYAWDEKTKSFVLSSFFWGYVITQVPAGQLAQKYGAKYLLLFGILICSVLTILTPICAKIGDWELVCGLRVLQGICQGVIFPSTHALLSKWSPSEERGRLVAFCYSGCQFGTVVMLASSGLLASSTLGWPSIFYISGAIGIIWAVIWLYFGASSPSLHKHISFEERDYIEKSIQGDDNSVHQGRPTPWLAICSSPAFLSILVAHCGHNWGFWTLLTEMPSYMQNVFDMDIKENALFSALPYLAMWILSYFFSYAADALSKRNVVSLSTNRKLFNSIGHWMPMLALIGLAYVTKENASTAVVLLVVAIGLNAATYVGFQVNHIDLAPNYAGTMMGITNCMANIVSILAPLTVGLVVSDEKNAMQWRTVFFIAAGIYFVDNLCFIIFGSSKRQSWNTS